MLPRSKYKNPFRLTVGVRSRQANKMLAANNLAHEVEIVPDKLRMPRVSVEDRLMPFAFEGRSGLFNFLGTQCATLESLPVEFGMFALQV